MTQAARAQLLPPPPAWDHKAVARPYLVALREQAQQGAFEAHRVDELMTELVAELRQTYETKDADVALASLERVMANIDQQAARVRTEAGLEIAPHARQHWLAEAAPRWRQWAWTRPAAAAPKPAAAKPAPPRGQDWTKTAGKLARQSFAFAATNVQKARKAIEAQAELRTQREAAARDAARVAAELAEAEAKAAAEAEPIIAPEPEMAGTALALNGRALRKSIVPTWLALVGLSWVSLIWGAIISMPFGVGLAIIGSLVAGIISVPLWGTIFGFAGMGSAASSTLSGMGFKPLPPEHPLNQRLNEFCTALDLPKPKLGTINAANAFAMGANEETATVAIGQPLLEKLTPAEVEAILGHELGHVVSGDMRRMMLMRTFQNATVWYMFAQGMKQFVRWIICWAAELTILGFSRNREYWADAIGAALAGKEAMMSALVKIHDLPAITNAENTHARFMFRGRVAGMFNTHPSCEQRVQALRNGTYINRLPTKSA